MSKTKTIDLSTITSIPTGSNIITVKARAAGYADSNSSNSVTYDKTSHTVTINFTNGIDTSQWESTRIYEKYTYTDTRNLYLYSTDQIGSISGANGSATVTTTTGKILIFGVNINDWGTESPGNITCSSGIETIGTFAYEEETEPGVFQYLGYSYVDDVNQYSEYRILLYAFNVTADGTITINQADWGKD